MKLNKKINSLIQDKQHLFHLLLKICITHNNKNYTTEYRPSIRSDIQNEATYHSRYDALK